LIETKKAVYSIGCLFLYLVTKKGSENEKYALKIFKNKIGCFQNDEYTIARVKIVTLLIFPNKDVKVSCQKY